MTRAWLVLAVLALLGAGCGGDAADGGGDSCPAGTVLDVKPDSINVRAGSGPVEIYGGLSAGCQAMVGFALSGPGTLAPTSGIPVYYTPPVTVAATTSATITATAAGLSDTIAVTITP